MTTRRYGDREVLTELGSGLPPYLERIVGAAPSDPGGWRLESCDYRGCFEGEHQDILDGASTELRPIYLDLRDSTRICAACVAAGRHLDDETTKNPE